MAESANIFSGLKVLDVASFIAGPAATTILSDFGADVIKVEPPGIGDPYRYFYRMPPNPVSDTNYAWQLTNRNKRSIALDLKSAQAKPVLQRLVQWADVMVTNFPPKVKSALGLTYEAVRPINPRLVYADITGYGAAGPEADKPGFDITAYWARTGLMEVTHDAGSPPTLPIPGIGDHATASTLYSAIVTGLYLRERTGKGTHVSTSLIAEGAWGGGRLDIFGVVQNEEEIVHDPQMLANDILVPMAEPNGAATLTVNSPIQVTGVAKVAPGRAPGLGEHGASILKELGFTDAEIGRLYDSGAVPPFKE